MISSYDGRAGQQFGSYLRLSSQCLGTNDTLSSPAKTRETRVKPPLGTARPLLPPLKLSGTLEHNYAYLIGSLVIVPYR